MRIFLVSLVASCGLLAGCLLHMTKLRVEQTLSDAHVIEVTNPYSWNEEVAKQQSTHPILIWCCRPSMMSRQYILEARAVAELAHTWGDQLICVKVAVATDSPHIWRLYLLVPSGNDTGSYCNKFREVPNNAEELKMLTSDVLSSYHWRYDTKPPPR